MKKNKTTKKQLKVRVRTNVVAGMVRPPRVWLSPYIKK